MGVVNTSGCGHNKWVWLVVVVGVVNTSECAAVVVGVVSSSGSGR